MPDLYLEQQAKNQALFKAIEDGDLKGVQRALKDGAQRNGERLNRQTPLLSAIEHAVGPREEEIVYFLMKQGCDVHHANNDGWSTLSYAVSVQSQNIIKKLISAGVDPKTVTNDGQDLLEIHLQSEPPPSTRSQQDSVFQMLYRVLKKTVKKKEYPTYDAGECNLLLFAAYCCRPEAVRFLVSEGWDINQQNKLGLSALHCISLYRPDRADHNNDIINGMHCFLDLGIKTSLKTKKQKETALEMLDKTPRLTPVKNFLKEAIIAQEERAELQQVIETVAKSNSICDNDTTPVETEESETNDRSKPKKSSVSTVTARSSRRL